MPMQASGECIGHQPTSTHACTRTRTHAYPHGAPPRAVPQDEEQIQYYKREVARLSREQEALLQEVRELRVAAAKLGQAAAHNTELEDQVRQRARHKARHKARPPGAPGACHKACLP